MSGRVSSIVACKLKPCAAPIRFVVSRYGTRVPVEADAIVVDPDPAGETVVLLESGGRVRGRRVVGDGPGTRRGYEPHADLCGGRGHS